MELATKLCWFMIAAIHAFPAAVLFRPALTESLYNVPSNGSTGILLVHRGALFLAVVVVAIFAAVAPEARKAATLLAAVSVLSFLVIYVASGAPEGSLRTIAFVDLFAMLPLSFVVWSAWLRR